MKVMIAKFGGTSVSRKERVSTICAIAKRSHPQKMVIVVSALNGMTDLLLSLVTQKEHAKKSLATIRRKHVDLITALWSDPIKRKELVSYVDWKLATIEKLLKKTKKTAAFADMITSFGEIMSSFLITHALQASGSNARQVIASDIIVTDDNFGQSEFLVDPTRKQVKRRLLPMLKKNIIPVVTGFIGASSKGKITTLGRGGSDYTATILGYCLNAYEIQIWTDVNGIFTADPRVVKNARPLSEVSFREASEMAFFGAKILHPRTLRPAIRANIPVRILNTLSPESKGTLITKKQIGAQKITAITSKKKVILINMYSTGMLFTKGFLAKLFSVFAKHNISIDLVSVSEVSVSVTLEDGDDHLREALKDLKTFTSINVDTKAAMISLIGENITSSSDTLKSIFELLHRKRIAIKMISFGATNINISFVIGTEELDGVVRLLHDELLLKQVNKE